VAVPALAHRLVLRPELWVRRIDADSVVARLLDSVPAPRALDDDERVQAGPRDEDAQRT
jgi:MoxR-like ATPase